MFKSGCLKYVLIVIAVCSAALCVSCSGGKEGRAGKGTLIVGEMSNYEGLNPMSTTDAHARDIYEQMFLSLLDENDDFMTFEPRLATSYEFSEDRRELTFKLREDVYWSDGVKFTSRDVVETFWAQKDPATGWSSRHLKEHIDSVEATGDYEVVYHFSKVYPYQVMDTRDGPILPAHIIKDIPHEELGNVPVERFPVTGPFMIEQWEKGQKLVLKANPRYYDDDIPRLSRVIFKIIPDQVTLVTQLRHGEVDCMEAVPEDQIDNIMRDNPELKIFDFLGRGYNYIGWNGAVDPFGSVRVRRALTMAIDRKKIIETAKYGYAEECVSPFIPLIWAYNPDIEPLPYDPERALELLKAEGFSDTDGDGFLDRGGERFEFELLTNHGSQVRADIQVMVQEMLRKVGIKVNPVQLEWTVMLDKHKSSDFEAIITAWRTGTKADLAPIWSCDARKEGGYNRVDYCNATVDSLNDLATSTLDFDEARPLFHRAQEIIYEEQPYTFLYFSHTIFVLNKEFGGAEPDAISCFHNLHEWYRKDQN